MHIVDMVYFWARTIPERPAVIQPDLILSYRTLTEGIESAAQHFARSIADKSKPVTVSLESNPKVLIAGLGLLRAGFSVIIATRNQLAYVAPENSATLVAERDGVSLSDRTKIIFEESWIRTSGGTPRQSVPLPQPRTRNADIFFFTSGTTGRPKLVVRKQQAWDQRILFSGTSAFEDYERALLLTGLNNSMGFTRAYESLYAGKTICFAPTGLPMLWLANTFDIDLIVASPQQALKLAELQEKVTRYPLTALKTIKLGGSVLSIDGIERIQNYLCRNVIINYSSAEAGIVAIAPYDMIAHIPNAVGFLIPDAEVQIVDAADNIVPAGAEGFVRLRTAQYLLNFQIEDPNAWFYPGDVGWLTEDGVLCIAGRKGDVLNRGGVKLSMNDFEEFLRSCPGVQDAGVCSVMAVAGFEEIWVGLALEPAADIGALRAHIDSNTNFSGNIDKLFVVEAIPRSTLGKIQRDELKQMLQSISEEADSSVGKDSAAT